MVLARKYLSLFDGSDAGGGATKRAHLARFVSNYISNAPDKVNFRALGVLLAEQILWNTPD
jgi:hypothetical protein